MLYIIFNMELNQYISNIKKKKNFYEKDYYEYNTIISIDKNWEMVSLSSFIRYHIIFNENVTKCHIFYDSQKKVPYVRLFNNKYEEYNYSVGCKCCIPAVLILKEKKEIGIEIKNFTETLEDTLFRNNIFGSTIEKIINHR